MTVDESGAPLDPGKIDSIKNTISPMLVTSDVRKFRLQNIQSNQ